MTQFFTCDICGVEFDITHLAYIEDIKGFVCKTCHHYGLDKVLEDELTSINYDS